MRTFLSATVTLEELKAYFKHGGETPLKKEKWASRAKDDESGGFFAESPTFEVDLTPKGASFHVKISAVDDPSDSDEKTTDDPSGFIAEFLKTGGEGDEVFGKMAGTDMSPHGLAGLLRFLALEARTGKITKNIAANTIRRSCALVRIGDVRQSIRAASNMVTRIALDLGEARSESESSSIKKLQSTLEKKGWKTKVSEDDRGMPQIKVDVAGVYEAVIIVDHVIWKYSFQIKAIPDTLSEGVTDDPIEEFRRFFKDPELQDKWSEFKEKRDEKSHADQDTPTVPPPRKK